ncbi:MAG TPA: type II secretion system protein [Burkholderiales bacterium]|nr:type II secretion system protein [Burkholderiales bacterium]
MKAGQHGFTYLTILFLLAIMSGGLALAGEVWHTSATREKEAELLFIGNEYRKAIERYYLAGSGVRQYPKTLADLVKDPRQPGTVRHLRKLYPDPITGKDEWGLVKSADGGFAGVHSLSEAAPVKTAGFAVRDASFEGKTKYAEWQFVFAPPQAPAAKPGAKPAPGATPEASPVPKGPAKSG